MLRYKANLADEFLNCGLILFETFPEILRPSIRLNFQVLNLEPARTANLAGKIGFYLFSAAAALRLSYDLVVGVPEIGSLLARVFSQSPRNGKIIPLLKFAKRSRKNNQFHYYSIICGKYRPGETALLIDDYIAEADSQIEVIKMLAGKGVFVEDVLVVIDTEQEAEKLKKEGVRIYSIFQISELLDYYVATNRINPDKRNQVLAYFSANKT